MTTKAPTRRNDALLNDLLNDAADDYERETKAPAKARRSGPRIGFLSPEGIETAFLVLLYLATFLLALLSVLGTFYGLAGQAAPVNALQIVRDIAGDYNRLLIAMLLQTVFTLSQYGARQWARRDPRWWFGYLAALLLSVWFNIQAYADPLVALHVPWLVAWCIIILGDVLPEFIVVRKP